MKHLLIITLSLLCCLSVEAQKIKVGKVVTVTSDLDARTHPKKDVNEAYCALLKVEIPVLKDLVFKRDWVTDVAYTPGEYWVYIPQTTKKVIFSHEKYGTGEIILPEPAKEKVVYKVTLELPEAKKIHVTDANAKMEEARKLFDTRKYKDAKIAYDGASYAKDITAEQKTLCLKAISLCDSCSYYTRIVNGAYKEMKAQQTMDQQAAANCADIAIQAMKHLNILNPSSFYETKIQQLQDMVKTMPLAMRFTVVKWVKSAAGMEEGGAMPNVEIWSLYDNGTSTMLGKSDGTGIVDVNLDRNNLPSRIEFRPIGYSKKTQGVTYNLKDMMQNASSEHSKRQVRIQLYVK